MKYEIRIYANVLTVEEGYVEVEAESEDDARSKAQKIIDEHVGGNHLEDEQSGFMLTECIEYTKIVDCEMSDETPKTTN